MDIENRNTTNLRIGPFLLSPFTELSHLFPKKRAIKSKIKFEKPILKTYAYFKNSSTVRSVFSCSCSTNFCIIRCRASSVHDRNRAERICEERIKNKFRKKKMTKQNPRHKHAPRVHRASYPFASLSRAFA